MSPFLIKFKNINKFFRLFGGYDYDDCCCGGSCSCCGSGHDSYTSLKTQKNIHLFGGYDYDDCCCGGSCSCCGSGHRSGRSISEKNSNSFVLNSKRADVPLA